jgi:hypothetical protein
VIGSRDPKVAILLSLRNFERLSNRGYFVVRRVFAWRLNQHARINDEMKRSIRERSLSCKRRRRDIRPWYTTKPKKQSSQQDYCIRSWPAERTGNDGKDQHVSFHMSLLSATTQIDGEDSFRRN